MSVVAAVSAVTVIASAVPSVASGLINLALAMWCRNGATFVGIPALVALILALVVSS